jgi:hypothetical protein
MISNRGSPKVSTVIIEDWDGLHAGVLGILIFTAMLRVRAPELYAPKSSASLQPNNQLRSSHLEHGLTVLGF